MGNKLNRAQFEASHLGGSLWAFKDIVTYRTVDGQGETVIEASGVVHRDYSPSRAECSHVITNGLDLAIIVENNRDLIPSRL